MAEDRIWKTGERIEPKLHFIKAPESNLPRAAHRLPTEPLQSVLVLFWTRLGSLNALETLAPAPFWKQWLGREMPSADTLGRVYSRLDAAAVRAAIHHVYERLKRNKALPGIGGLGVAVLDDHEPHASYRRCCRGCLKRTVQRRDGQQMQYYHRQVTLLLLSDAPPGSEPLRLLLDAEPQRPGEDEMAAAHRLLARVLETYPRAFDVHCQGRYVEPANLRSAHCESRRPFSPFQYSL